MNEHAALVARLCRALDRTLGEDQVTTLAVAFATAILDDLPPEPAAQLARRLAAIAQAAEELPETATSEEIYALGLQIEKRIN